MSEPIHIISLGAGVQSSTLALMASEGEITPMPLGGIFADTQQEPASVYRWLSFLCGVPLIVEGPKIRIEPGEYQSGVLRFPVYIVTKGNLGDDALRVRRRKDGNGSWVPSGIPHYSVNSDGSHGQGPRQCTHDFKLLPILAKQTELVGRSAIRDWRRKHKSACAQLSQWEKEFREWKRKRKKLGKDVAGHAPVRPLEAWMECQRDPLLISWIGISTDEISRVKPPIKPWINSRYPHIENRKSRYDCLLWLKRRNLKAPRSACKQCPYHSDDEWQRLKNDEPFEFEEACQFEEAYQAAKIQTVGLSGFMPYLHASRQPLRTVVFKTNGNGEPSLFNSECEGMCGV